MQASQTVPATTQQVENYLINIFCQIQKRCVLVGLSFWVTVHLHLNYCSKYFSKKIFEWSTFRIRRQPWCNIDIETDIEKYHNDDNKMNYIKQLPGSEDHRGVRKCSAERYTVMTRSPGKHICLFYVQVKQGASLTIFAKKSLVWDVFGMHEDLLLLLLLLLFLLYYCH